MQILFILLPIIVIIIVQFIAIISNNWVEYNIDSVPNKNIKIGLWKGCVNNVCADVDVSKSSSTILITRIFTIISLILLVVSCILLFLPGMTTKNIYLILVIAISGILSTLSSILFSQDRSITDYYSKLGLPFYLELISGIILIISSIILKFKLESKIEK